MGYSTTKNAIDKVSNHLAEMMATDEEIVWLTEEPDRLRYLIFQALKSADEFSSEGEPYVSIAKLRYKFKIRTAGRKVIAEPRRVSPLEAIRAQVQSKVVVRDVYDTPGIIAAINLYKAAEIVFLGASDQDQNLEGLYEVAKKHGYYMIPATTHITFSKNPDDEVLAWTPEEK